VMPGVDSDSTLLYGPEIKFYAMRIKTDKTLGRAWEICGLVVTGRVCQGG
jgi:uncharacterized FAD-dependent dehydrogenase